MLGFGPSISDRSKPITVLVAHVIFEGEGGGQLICKNSRREWPKQPQTPSSFYFKPPNLLNYTLALILNYKYPPSFFIFSNILNSRILSKFVIQLVLSISLSELGKYLEKFSSFNFQHSFMAYDYNFLLSCRRLVHSFHLLLSLIFVFNL